MNRQEAINQHIEHHSIAHFQVIDVNGYPIHECTICGETLSQKVMDTIKVPSGFQLEFKKQEIITRLEQLLTELKALISASIATSK